MCFSICFRQILWLSLVWIGSLRVLRNRNGFWSIRWSESDLVEQTNLVTMAPFMWVSTGVWQFFLEWQINTGLTVTHRNFFPSQMENNKDQNWPVNVFLLSIRYMQFIYIYLFNNFCFFIEEPYEGNSQSILTVQAHARDHVSVCFLW